MIFLLDFLFIYNWIFKIYLILIFSVNIYICIKFTLPILNKNNLIKIAYNLDNSNDIDYNYDEYLQIFKKLIKITNNPIIFEYQLEQSKKIDKRCDKYIKHKKFITNIKNIINHTINDYEDYDDLKNDFIRIQKILSIYNKNDDMLIKLLCINF